MSSKKNDAFSEVIIGVFMLAVLSLLVYFTIVISGVDLISGRRKVCARIAFSDVGGLKDHDNVMYRGMKVGTIKEIELQTSNLIVTAEIESDVVLRSSSRIAVCNLSMLGGNYLLLEEGKGEVQPLETTLFHGETPTDWMRDIAQIAKNLNAFTSDESLGGIVTNLQVTTEKVRSLVTRIENGEGFVGKLLSADDKLYNDLASAVADVREMTDRLSKGEGTLGKLLSKDEGLYTNLVATVANAQVLSARLKNGEGFVGRMLDSNDPMYDNVTKAIDGFRKACESMDAQETFNKANNLLENLTDVSKRLKEGEGTIGKLLNDDELYREVNGLTKDVRQVIDNFRDTTPISTFGSLIMGGL